MSFSKYQGPEGGEPCAREHSALRERECLGLGRAAGELGGRPRAHFALCGRARGESMVEWDWV